MSDELGRLRWGCRRGMKELEVVLEYYLEQGYPCADQTEQSAFARLLQVSDPELAAWLIYGRPCPHPHLAQIVSILRRCGPLNLISKAQS